VIERVAQGPARAHVLRLMARLHVLRPPARSHVLRPLSRTSGSTTAGG
jgi:hypothetical protein